MSIYEHLGQKTAALVRKGTTTFANKAKSNIQTPHRLGRKLNSTVSVQSRGSNDTQLDDASSAKHGNPITGTVTREPNK